MKSIFFAIVIVAFFMLTSCTQNENIYRIGSEAKEYVVKDSLGNVMVKGIGFQVDFTKYKPGKYFVCFDDTSDVFIKKRER